MFPYTSYPRHLQDGRYVRDPYTDRTLRELDRANDPYAYQRRSRDDSFVPYPRRSLDSNFDRRRFREEQQQRRPAPPPIVTVTAPTEDQHRSITPSLRRGPYPYFRRDSESPAPRASRRRLSNYQDTFGGLPAPAYGGGERLRYDPGGPSRNPFSSRRHGGIPTPNASALPNRPYGGGPAPRNPFVPGGDLYNYERQEGRRHHSLERGYTGVRDQNPHRPNYYRDQVGEPWGVAEYEAYRSRRRNEERMRGL